MKTKAPNKNRTTGIWILSAYLFLRGVFSLSNLAYAFFSGHRIQLADEQGSYVLGVTWLSLGYFYSLAYMFAGIKLFKMQREAYYYVIVVSTSIIVDDLFTLWYKHGILYIVKMIPALAVFAAVVLYVRSLYKKGILQ